MPSSGHWIYRPLFMNQHPANPRRLTTARMKDNMLQAANSTLHGAEVRNPNSEIREKFELRNVKSEHLAFASLGFQISGPLSELVSLRFWGGVLALLVLLLALLAGCSQKDKEETKTPAAEKT